MVSGAGACAAISTRATDGSATPGALHFADDGSERAGSGHTVGRQSTVRGPFAHEPDESDLLDAHPTGATCTAIRRPAAGSADAHAASASVQRDRLMSDSLPYMMPGGVGQRPLLVPAQVASSQGLPGGNMAPSSLASALLGRNSPTPGLQAPQI